MACLLTCSLVPVIILNSAFPTLKQRKRPASGNTRSTVTSYLSAVVHAGAKVIRDAEYDNLSPRSRLEVVQLAFSDAVPVNNHVDVTIWSALFVPEPDRVSDLVRYRTVLHWHCTSGHRVVRYSLVGFGGREFDARPPCRPATTRPVGQQL